MSALLQIPQDLALAYDVMQGTNPYDHACAQRTNQPTLAELSRGIEGLRIARLTGYFDEYAGVDARWAARAAGMDRGMDRDADGPSRLGRTAARHRGRTHGVDSHDCRNRADPDGVGDYGERGRSERRSGRCTFVGR